MSNQKTKCTAEGVETSFTVTVIMSAIALEQFLYISLEMHGINVKQLVKQNV